MAQDYVDLKFSVVVAPLFDKVFPVFAFPYPVLLPFWSHRYKNCSIYICIYMSLLYVFVCFFCIWLHLHTYQIYFTYRRVYYRIACIKKRGASNACLNSGLKTFHQTTCQWQNVCGRNIVSILIWNIGRQTKPRGFFN